MEDVLIGYSSMKLSALSKSKLINPYVNGTTIGPNSTFYVDSNDTKTIIPSLPPKKYDTPVKTNVINQSFIKQLYADIEMQRQKKVQEAVNSHANRIAEFSKQVHNHLNKNLEMKQKRLLNEKQQQELLILQTSEQHDKDASVQKQQLLQYYEELAERKKKIDQDLKEYERRKQLLASLIDQIKNAQVEFRVAYQDIISSLEGCKYPAELKMVLGDIPAKLKVLPNHMDEIVTKCKTGKVREDDGVKSLQLVKHIKDVLNELKQKIAKVTEEQEMKKQQIQEKQKVIIKRSESKTGPSKADSFGSKASLQIYIELQNFLENFANSYSNLANNNSFKDFKSDCKKAINFPVNAISTVSSQHLLDKYTRLLNLLTGKMVEVGGTYVSASRHPQGVAFCTNLLAQKFVLQSDLMISGKPEAAYWYAAVIIALWNDNPDFGKLILAHLYQQCPYLVPFYPPQLAGQSDRDFYLSLGYQYIDDVIEKQDKFLKRMTGMMRLYGAILISKPKRGQQKNPHGLSEAWRWLSSFLNLAPIPYITATMLHVFLETVGSAMQAAYGKVFKKLMYFICVTFLPMIQKIDNGGPVTRLEVLVQKYSKMGRFEEPQGLLPNNFW